MVDKTLTVSIIIGFSLVGLFLIWHFLMSIYEVKFITRPNGDILKQNMKFEIECIALNSFGCEIKYRDLKCEYTITEGNDLITVESSENNNFRFVANKLGKIKILVNSKYSLNPSIFKLNIEN